MRLHSRLIVILCLSLASTQGYSATPPKLHVVAVDPLIKIFRDADITADHTATAAETARGQHATFQLVTTSCPVTIKQLHCAVTTFTQTAGDQTLPPARIRYVGYVGSSVSAKKAAHDQLRAAPAMYPDPLLEQDAIDVAAGDNQPCWISLKIPVDAIPGDYAATTTLAGKIFGLPTTTTVPLKLTVYPATITKTRLNVTNWFQMTARGDQPPPKEYSPEYWQMLRTYIHDMVEHRQNWARVETLWLVKYSRDDDGTLKFDFTNFDKWMQILMDEGIEHVEGLQFAWRGGKWADPYVVEIHDESDSSNKGTRVSPSSPKAKAFYSAIFPALYNHLKDKGWLSTYVQHVGDEPVKKNAASYTAAANYVRQYMPGVPVMEACLSHNMAGAIDIWVPILQDLDKDFDFFKARQKAGDVVWFYTCLNPQGEYANRFVELPLIKTRLLHWINYRYGITGYLHWGYNFWRPHPWDDASQVGGGLPGGDAWIVYPAKDGFGIVDSIRWEAMRDGIEDHELLSQLGDHDPEAAMNLAKREVMDFDHYDTDVKSFRKVRHELLEAVSRRYSELKAR